MNTNQIFALLESLFLIIKALDFIYLFQIKEYRFDRFTSLLREEGIVNVFFVREIHMPAKKLRNFLLAIFALLTTGIFFISFKNISLLSLIIFVPTLPFVAFAGITIGVIATSIIVGYHRKRLINKAADMVKESKAMFIGITGSFGKTSTKEFLHQILSVKYNVEKTEKNMNSDVGVAISIIKNLKKDTEIFIVEMGAYRLGEIKDICRFVKPDRGILTGIGNQHLDLFGSKENLVQAKKELFEAIPENGTSYINKDVQDLNKVLEGLKCHIKLYSTHKAADITAKNILLENHTIHADIQYLSHNIKITIPILGKHNINNLLPCIACAFDLDISEKEIIERAAKLHSPLNKLTIHHGPNNSTLIFDSNNTNVEGFISSIETASNFPHSKKLIVSRGIIELGHEKQTSYNRITEEINQKGLLLYTTDELFQFTNQARSVRFFHNEQELLTDLIAQVDRDTLVVVEGKFTQKFIKNLRA